jgi:hypothetical protein
MEKRKQGRPNIKVTVGYVERPVHQSCSNCRHFASDMSYPAWVLREGEDAIKAHEARGGAKIETKLRCEKHGFGVRRLAICKTWEAKA